jgi:hypothetical protein
LFKSRDSTRAGRTAGDWLPALLLGIVGWLYTGLYFNHGLDAFDEGLYATEAQRVLDGGVYGKDFLAPYGPGRYYLIAGLFWIFGASLKVQCFFWLVLRGLIALLVFRAGRRLLPFGFALLPALAVILAPGALHKSLFQITVLLNLLAYFAYRREGTLLSCTWVGFAVGLAALLRVDVGVFGIMSFLVLLLLEFLWDWPRPTLGRFVRRLGAFAAGAACLTLPVALYVGLNTDLVALLKAEWHRTLTVSAFAETLSVPGIGEALTTPYPQGLKLFLMPLMLYGAPAAYLLLTLCVIGKRIKGHTSGFAGLEAVALVAFGVPVLNQVRITPTFNHLLHAMPLVFLSAAILVRIVIDSALFKALPGRMLRSALALLVILPPFAVPVYYNFAFTKGVLPGSVLNRFEFTEPLSLERAGIFETPDQVERLEKMVRYIQTTTAPGETLFAGPFDPALNFLAERPPAVRYLEPFYYLGSDSMQQSVVHDLIQNRPPLIVIDPAIRVGGQSLESDAPRIMAFIKQHYRLANRTGWKPGDFQIWLAEKPRR